MTMNDKRQDFPLEDEMSMRQCLPTQKMAFDIVNAHRLTYTSPLYILHVRMLLEEVFECWFVADLRNTVTDSPWHVEKIDLLTDLL